MLHKTSYLMGFHLLATDGEIGHVDDLLVDERCAVRYLVVDTSNWIGGRSVLIAPAAIERIDSAERQIRVNLSRDRIAKSPSMSSAEIELIETLPDIVLI